MLRLLSLIFSMLLIGVQVQAENTVKLVSSLPRTGSANAQTTTMVNAIRLALEEANYQAGPFKLVYEDWDGASPERGQWDPAVEAVNAERAVRDADIVSYIGTYNSGAAKISMPKLNQAGLLMISPGTTWPGLTKPGIGEPNEPWVYRPTKKITFFRVVPADDIQGSVAAKWASRLGVKKVYVLHDGELYGKGIASVFKKSAPAEGLTLSGYEQIDPKASNYRSLAIKIKHSTPDLVYFGGTTQTNAGQLAKDLRSAGFQGKFMVPDGCFEKAFIEAAGAANLNGKTYVTFGGLPPNKLTGKGKEFYQRYVAKYSSEPESYAAYSYEATKVVLAALAKAGSKDRAAVIEAIKQLGEFDGILGKWSFDPNGDTTLRTMSGNIVENGTFVFQETLG